MWICEYVIGRSIKKSNFGLLETWQALIICNDSMKKEHSLENGNRERAGIAAMSCVWTCAHNCNIKV